MIQLPRWNGWRSLSTYMILKNPATYLHHVASHGLWFTMSGVKFSKCSMKMILKYWKQKEHHDGAIFLLNIHLRVRSSKTSKHSTVAFTDKKYYSASVWPLWSWFLITSSTGILMKRQTSSILTITSRIYIFQYPCKGVMGLVHIPHNLKTALCLQYKQDTVKIPLQQCLR